jgi:ketosteroid isomerase-like protein
MAGTWSTRPLGFAAIVVALAGGPGFAQQRPVADLQQEVRGREQAFAKTMADRDLAAFGSFLAPDAIFVGPGGASRGPQEITAAWKRFFEGSGAPFSWRPETVEVLASGTLALSSGPVFDPKGARIGTFNSVWRREPDGVWRIVFDNGCP